MKKKIEFLTNFLYFRSLQLIQNPAVSKNPISIEECQTDEIMNQQQYLENSIQHLEIVPVDESVTADGLT